jgi:hypothetical protein
MNESELLQRSIVEAQNALGIGNELGAYFERRGGYTGWDEAISKNVFEAQFHVWRATVIMDIELDPDTGEIISSREIKNENKV